MAPREGPAKGRHSSEWLIWLTGKYHAVAGHHCATPHDAHGPQSPGIQRLGKAIGQAGKGWPADV